ncbi:hypothetical protein SAMN05444287_0405 [Octadecabacter temperatus]|uniref:Uncharacterized protein n=1 Tax=Octadecabacter temperatus TaxID=1458307 RepID=A0A0K0Y2Y8_9RHOB|nr:hypothetical protein [Octadecabacter temperatus]AKS45313.1 hypothetical protein OSB_07520 [Octadecabacter temperatus]SIN90333.1 hypothetical protein SAMN05444287_0405 [Octadecabacter temperatus]
MAIRAEHEIHSRRKGRNFGVGLLLLGFIGIVFGLTVVKVLGLTDIRQLERFDHVARPQLEPGALEAAEQRAADLEAASESEASE